MLVLKLSGIKFFIKERETYIQNLVSTILWIQDIPGPKVLLLLFGFYRYTHLSRDVFEKQ